MVFQLNIEGETLATIPLDAPLCVPPSAPLREVVERMRQGRKGSALVVADRCLVGIFTERDALRLMAASMAKDEPQFWDRPVSDEMTARPVVVRRGDSVATAIERMAAGGYRHLPVIDDSAQPIGEITVALIQHYLVEHFPTVVYNLPPEPHQKPKQREGA